MTALSEATKEELVDELAKRGGVEKFVFTTHDINNNHKFFEVDCPATVLVV